MCGRYITPEQAEIERYWGLTTGEAIRRIWNAAPSMTVPVIRSSKDGEPELNQLQFGFRPPWAKRAWINARAETFLSSKAFESAARERRCLVPAVGWYEWQGEKAPKQPYVYHLNGFRPFAFAGIWTARQVDSEWLPNFAIITRSAAPYLEHIHDRMPALIDPRNYESWLSRETDARDIQALIHEPFDAVLTYAVSTYVNKPEHDGPKCIEPVKRTDR